MSPKKLRALADSLERDFMTSEDRCGWVNDLRSFAIMLERRAAEPAISASSEWIKHVVAELVSLGALVRNYTDIDEIHGDTVQRKAVPWSRIVERIAELGKWEIEEMAEY